MKPRHATAVADDQSILWIIQHAPAQSIVCFSNKIIVNYQFSVRESCRSVHFCLFIFRKDRFLVQRSVPGKHVEDGCVRIVAAIKAVRADHVSSVFFRDIRGNITVVFQDHIAGKTVGGPPIPAGVEDRGILHTGGLEEILFEEVLKPDAGDFFHRIGDQAVSDVRVPELFTWSTGSRLTAFADEAQDLAARRDPVFLFQNRDDPI